MRNGVDSRRYFRNICRKKLKSYMTNNLISGGVNMYYRSTLVYKLSKRIHLRKSFRKEKIKKLFNEN